MIAVEEDYRIVNMQGGVVFDSAVEREQQEALLRAREGEPFTATTDCPWCGHIAVHWLARPIFEPALDDRSPAARALRMVNATFDAVALLIGPPRRRWDPPGTAVARVCLDCGYRWGQS